jgi:site-specific DNA-methyltransferase (adenine-specific)
MPRNTRTYSFGASRREGHDASLFYSRSLYRAPKDEVTEERPALRITPLPVAANWQDAVFCQSSEALPIPDNSVALAFTSPPYNNGKEYDRDMTLEEYLGLIGRVGQEVYRVLKPGGRYGGNVANLGRKPYIPLHAYFYQVHQEVGFLPMGEIIWRKARGANGNCAWGSWCSAKSPRLRDIHEYLLVFAKANYSRPDRGVSDVTGEEFMEATLSVWEIPAEMAERVGHPAPFPVALAERVIKLLSYRDDVVLDPFMGSGSTCVAAARLGRRYVGFDISSEYCALARHRIAVAVSEAGAS